MSETTPSLYTDRDLVVLDARLALLEFDSAPDALRAILDRLARIESDLASVPEVKHRRAESAARELAGKFSAIAAIENIATRNQAIRDLPAADRVRFVASVPEGIVQILADLPEDLQNQLVSHAGRTVAVNVRVELLRRAGRVPHYRRLISRGLTWARATRIAVTDEHARVLVAAGAGEVSREPGVYGAPSAPHGSLQAVTDLLKIAFAPLDVAPTPATASWLPLSFSHDGAAHVFRDDVIDLILSVDAALADQVAKGSVVVQDCTPDEDLDRLRSRLHDQIGVGR